MRSTLAAIIGATTVLVAPLAGQKAPVFVSHFHIADRPRAIDAEGIPYAFAAFALEAEPEVVTPALRAVGGSLEIGPSGLASWKDASPRRREREIPLLNAIVTFLDR